MISRRDPLRKWMDKIADLSTSLGAFLLPLSPVRACLQQRHASTSDLASVAAAAVS